MNLRIVHSSFTLDLVDTSFTMVEENNWFTDAIFTKYTYPISRVLTDEEDVAFNFLTSLCSQNITTVFDVYFFVMDTEHRAVMEIERIKGRKIDFQVRYGFEEFPNFEKKLAQLPLHNFNLSGTTIFAHAATLVHKGYPDTDYAFPRLFSDAFDKESPQWEAFLGSINNYNGVSFVENQYDAVNDKQLNRNVLQPLPSLLYVLKTGFAERGYTLAGDILTDPDFSKAWLFSLSKYYSTISDGNKQEFIVKCDENIGLDPNLPATYVFYKTLQITEPGRYKIAGNLFLQPPLDGERNREFAIGKLEIGTKTLGYWENISPMERFLMLDIIFDILPGQEPMELKYSGIGAHYRVMGETRIYDAAVLDITISKISSYRPDGSLEPTLVTPNNIDLTQCVPDATFGELFKAIKNYKNYGIDIKGDMVYMNLVRNEIGKDPTIDLSHTEVREPEVEFNHGKSFELMFAEVSSEDYEFPSMFIDRNGSAMSPYTKKEDTEEITINAIPLPLKKESSITTAHAFLDDNQKIQLVLYDGLDSGMNTTDDPSALMIPEIYQEYYKDWIEFLLKTLTYRWEFNDFDINLAPVKPKATIFAYGKRHTVLSLSRKNLGADDIIQTEIETYSIE